MHLASRNFRLFRNKAWVPTSIRADNSSDFLIRIQEAFPEGEEAQTKAFTNLPKRSIRLILYLIVAFTILGLVIFDRISWASISQWREDQATSIWLGYVQPITSMPVGLVSSQAIPNPNGMLLLGILLSRLPGLWFISSFLGISQALLLIWLCWTWFGKTKFFLLSSSILLFSTILRATSIEFWNQWIIQDLNIFFFIFISKYLQRPSVTKIPAIIFCILFAPALYLGGLVNSLGYFILFAFLFITTRSSLNKRHMLPVIFISIIIIGTSLALTWIPYFQAVNASVHNTWFLSSPGLMIRQITVASISLLGFIGWSNTWIIRLIPSVMFIDSHLIPTSAACFIYAHNFILVYLTLVSFIALGFACISSLKIHKNFSSVLLHRARNQGKIIILALLFILSCFTITPLLKGPAWIFGERIDMTFQYLPFFFIFLFITPSVVQVPEVFRKLTDKITVGLSVAFVVVNIILGWMTIESVKDYSGSFLTQSDVPLYQKLNVIQFVANDWSARSTSQTLPVYYDLNAALLPEEKGSCGENLSPWYSSPYTLGRAMDFELLRVYHLHNSQEGIIDRERNMSNAVYIIHYSFLPSTYSPDCYEEYTFDRISVAVLRPGKAICPNR